MDRLTQMEQTLDELIRNGSRLKECEEENGECSELQYQQERLLNELLKLNNALGETDVQKKPILFRVLKEKVRTFSEINRSQLKTTTRKKRN